MNLQVPVLWSQHSHSVNSWAGLTGMRTSLDYHISGCQVCLHKPLSDLSFHNQFLLNCKAHLNDIYIYKFCNINGFYTITVTGED